MRRPRCRCIRRSLPMFRRLPCFTFYDTDAGIRGVSDEWYVHRTTFVLVSWSENVSVGGSRAERSCAFATLRMGCCGAVVGRRRDDPFQGVRRMAPLLSVVMRFAANRIGLVVNF